MGTAAIVQMDVNSPQLNVLPIEVVRTILRNEVATILRQQIPALSMVSQDRVYDRVMGDPTLLSQSLGLFRARPDLFESVVMSVDNTFPRDDNEMLSCGRSLADAISLVVRACARRYFRTHLPAPKRPPPPQPKVGAVQSLMISLGWSNPPPKPKMPRIQSPGDKLFQAMRNFLRFEWQVPLIPVYAVLSLETVTRLGEKLLEFRDPQKLQALADQPVNAAPGEPKVPLLLDNAKRLMTGKGDSINAETLWRVAQEMRIAALFPTLDTAALRKMVALIAATNPKVLQILVPVLGGDIRHFTLYLFIALDCFGPVRYRQLLGGDSQTWVIKDMAQRVAKEPPLSGTNEEMRTRITDWLTQTLNTVKQDDAIKSSTLKALDKVK